MCLSEIAKIVIMRMHSILYSEESLLLLLLLCAYKRETETTMGVFMSVILHTPQLAHGGQRTPLGGGSLLRLWAQGSNAVCQACTGVLSPAKPPFWSVVKTLNGKFHCFSNNDHDGVLARDAGRPPIRAATSQALPRGSWCGTTLPTSPRLEKVH